jgi:hypothetical protein
MYMRYVIQLGRRFCNFFNTKTPRAAGRASMGAGENIFEASGPCKQVAGKTGFFRIKDGCPHDPYEYNRIHGTLPYEWLDEIPEDQFLDGSLKTISYGIPGEQIEAIVRRRESVLVVVPPQV